jgi:iron complex transport system ATP-binding protein
MITQDSRSVLSVNNLTLGYGTHILFDDLTLRVSAGKLTCLMGPNGSGKSTLLRSLAGLQMPLKGTIDGIDEKKIAVVLTDKIDASFMTVRELILFGRYPYLTWSIRLTAEDNNIIEKAIDATRTAHLLDKKLFELSDGQLQMCMIARALAQDTPVLILDEPTSHLDLNNRLEIMNMLRTLAHRHGKAIIMATHELDLALQCADNVWLAINGKIKTGMPEDLVLDGSFDEVFQFKGYDLKTGKVKHQPFRNMAIKLTGDGPVLLWTKNALERNGFSVDENSSVNVLVGENTWTLGETAFHSLGSLIASMIKEE